jgi:hypothetical protein
MITYDAVDRLLLWLIPLEFGDDAVLSIHYRDSAKVPRLV